MDLAFTAAELAFRDEARRFFRTEIPERIRAKLRDGENLGKEDMVASQRILNARGWATPNWPVEWGGQDWSPVQVYLYQDEMQQAYVPSPIAFNTSMVGPVIAQFGNDEQKRRFLPRAANADDFWCQGFSEPGSGSDLASLRTRAERKGDKYIVNGQKIWTTLAQYADWIFCLVRTDPDVKPQRGISMLLIDMKSPGVIVRPIITLDGAHEVNEVWFEDVEVPVGNRVGEENRGWTYAKFLLGHERNNIAGIGIAKRELARVKRVAAAELKNGRPLSADPLFAARLAEVEIDLMALAITNLRVLSADPEQGGGAEASILKIKGSEIQQTLSELLLQAAGPYARPFIGDALEGDLPPVGPAHSAALAAGYLNLRKLSIFGGANEIQKNIIAQKILGL
ncbi:MAG TPA: acyl-CoA dehydrogenase family protein [Rhodocyclaceae bacterium]|nr:acyl-CoA dehydrogenase family protein [Rhodocyclaceae bacterium]